MGKRENRQRIKTIWTTGLTVLLLGVAVAGIGLGIGASGNMVSASDKEDVVTLRVCNWEEYMDLGDWDEEERIDLENGLSILGEQTVYEDFEDWYYETYGQKVKVEYSCFGTNEDLYNQLTLGDVYDVVCPSDYMIMKLMAEDQLVPFSEAFFDETAGHNYYMKGVSPYIKQVFEENEIGGESWSRYAAGYMWGVTGMLYNPQKVSEEEASTWSVIGNKKFARQITIKDNVRDSYFAILGMLKADKLTSLEFVNAADYTGLLAEELNDVTTPTIQASEALLQQVRENVYSFETDSGKADMVSGKVVAGYQWSGDAVYAMDLAEEDGFYLNFAVPEECTNLWFDGWVMLKRGLEQDARKQQAAEAFVNFLSRPDIAVRNMYYIGYTSVIAGETGDATVWNYLKWNYEADSEEEDTLDYPLGYFFSGNNEDEAYMMRAEAEQTKRQLFAQYPSEDVIRRSAIMGYYPDEKNAEINQMWIHIRCFNLNRVPKICWYLCLIAVVAAVAYMGVKRLVKRRGK